MLARESIPVTRSPTILSVSILAAPYVSISMPQTRFRRCAPDSIWGHQGAGYPRAVFETQNGWAQLPAIGRERPCADQGV